MTWGSLKEATIWLSVSKEIDNLESSLHTVVKSKRNAKIWLSLSQRLVYLIKNNINDKHVYKATLGIVRYLRCLFFWSCERWEELEEEVNTGLKEDKSSAIYLMIKGFVYLQPLLNRSHVSNLWPNDFPFDKRNSLFGYAKKCFNQATKKAMPDQNAIIVAIEWSLAWMCAYNSDNKGVNKYVEQAWKKDGFALGSGWHLWICWLGALISDTEHTILINSLKK